MKRSVFFIGLLLIGFNIFAQNNGRITGKIVEQDTKEPVPQANIRILQQKGNNHPILSPVCYISSIESKRLSISFVNKGASAYFCCTFV
jgi:hypothetical protein